METYEIYIWRSYASRGFDLDGRQTASSPEEAILGFMQRKHLERAGIAQAFVVGEYQHPAVTLRGVTVIGGRLKSLHKQ